MTWLWIGLALLAAGVVYVLRGIKRLHAPTTGVRIDRATRPGRALVIVDLQTDFTTATKTSDWAEPDRACVFDRVSQLAHDHASRGDPVIVVRQVFDGALARALNGLFNGGKGNRGSAGTALDPRLDLPGHADFEKHMGDALSNPALEHFLANADIGHLHIVGLDGAWCVKNTAHGALNRGFGVMIGEDAVLSADTAKWQVERSALLAAGAEMV